MRDGGAWGNSLEPLDLFIIIRAQLLAPIDAPKAAPTPAPRATLFRHLLSSTLILNASLLTGASRSVSKDVADELPDDQGSNAEN